MFDLRSLLKNEPFINRLNIGSIGDVISAVSGFDTVAVTAFETDYLFYGITLKNLLEERGVTVFALSLDEGADAKFVKSFISDCDAVVVIGERKICDLVRLSGVKAPLIYVPTSLVIYHAFSPLVADSSTGLLLKREAKLPDKVIFDTEIIKRLKTRHVADAFSIVAAARFWLLEYEIGKTAYQKTCDAVGGLSDALTRLSGISNGVYGTLLTCQIYLAYAVNKCPELDFGADRYMAFLICATEDCPEDEARFFSAERITALYCRLLSLDITDNLIMPDYNGYVSALSDRLGISPIVVYENVAFGDTNGGRAALKRIYEGGIARFSTECKKDLKSLLKGYSAVYGGRKKRVGVSPENAARALALSAHLTDGLLKLAADQGITDLIIDKSALK